MKLISHRGNTSGPDPLEENKPSYITSALQGGYDVEIDVWKINNQWLLGHDGPQYKTTMEYLLQKNLLVHAKNLEALKELLQTGGVHCFWHQEDQYTISSHGVIISYPGCAVGSNTICMKPELLSLDTISGCYGLCSDYVDYYNPLGDTHD